MVVDADALAHVTGPLDVPALLTPHAGELARMLDVEREEVEAAQLRYAREAARRYDAVVLLKGRHTLVAAPTVGSASPRSAPPWLATAGAGDVLAGLCGALVAAGLDPFEAGSVGAWLHGAAAARAGAGGPLTAPGSRRRCPRCAPGCSGLPPPRRTLASPGAEHPVCENGPAMTAPSTSAGTARAEIVVDLDAVRRNVATLRRAVGDAAMMTVVKADGYGHGMVPVARAAREGGAGWLGVAVLEEALALRESGDTGKVLCWLAVPGEDYAPAIAAGVDLTAYTVAELDEVVAAARRAGRPARVQLKIDTGLNRGGSTAEQWPRLVGRRGRRGARRRAPGDRRLVALRLQ